MMLPTNPNRTPHSSSHEVVRFPAGALLTPPQASVSAGPSFTCPERRHGGGATGDIRPAAISAPVKHGDKTGSSFSEAFRLNSFPETRGSQHLIVIGGNRLGKADFADNDPHGLNPFCVSVSTNRTSQEGTPTSWKPQPRLGKTPPQGGIK